MAVVMTCFCAARMGAHRPENGQVVRLRPAAQEHHFLGVAVQQSRPFGAAPPPAAAWPICPSWWMLDAFP